MNGTSLQDLQNRENMERLGNVMNLQRTADRQYQGLQHLQHEQGHNVQHAVHQNQHMPYVVPHVTSAPSMVNLAQDINRNFPTAEQQAIQQEQMPTHVPSEIYVQEETGNKWFNKIPERLRDPVVIVVIFVILSQPVVRDTIGKYVKQINPRSDGNIPLIGVVIYGLIFAVLFDLSKRFLAK